jgi:hypothetical protein
MTTTKTITYGELPIESDGVFLLCRICGEQCSAMRGDYFWADPGEVVMHCEEPMRLVRMKVTYEEVSK